MNQFQFKQQSGCAIERKRSSNHFFEMVGKWRVEHHRHNRLIDIYQFLNDIVNVGKNDILGVYFHGDTQTVSANWVIGLINNAGYTGVVAGDTMSSHSGWSEFTSYSQANRVAWGPGASSSQSITNTTPAQFDITATATVQGVFIVNNNTKGGTTGTLWATALFSSPVPVNSGDTLKITYTLSC